MQPLDRFFQHGSALVAAADIPLDADAWQTLRALVEKVNYEKVVGGDTGDQHSVWVGRFINDVEQPQALSEHTQALLDIIMSDSMQNWYQQFMDCAEPLCLRRCQANKMLPGDFIGYHIDQDTTPDYDVTFIYQLDDQYQGGQFVVHHPAHGSESFHGPCNSIMVNRGDLPHEVKPVLSGCRRTLACFLSRNFGATRTRRQNIKTVS